MPVQIQQKRVIVFQSSGATPFRDQAGQPLFLQSHSDEDVKEQVRTSTWLRMKYEPEFDINPRLKSVLLKHHFAVALLQSVAGYGRRGRKGSGIPRRLTEEHIAMYLDILNENPVNQ